ncbi:MAG: methylmalonyl-CoA decarboxylase [Bacteroidales bacterium]|nr:methylmalonyl-CoA decarboxylase [Bacteroidales bacterium]
MKLIEVKKENLIFEIIIKNENQRNALSTDLLNQFVDAIDSLIISNSRVLIIRAAKGAKVWSSGFNIEELPEPGIDPVPYNHPLEVLIRAIEKVKIPIIALIEGSVWGGACDLAFSCDILIGTNNTSFAITPAKIGVPYNSLGINRILNRVSPNIAKELFFTACPISAERAFNLGILNHKVDADTIDAYTYSIANKIVSNSPLSISVIKKQIDSISRAKTVDIETISIIDELRQEAYNSDDYLEGKRAFMEKRKAVFKGV